MDVCKFIVSESKPVMGLSSMCVCVCACVRACARVCVFYHCWKLALTYMEVCNSCSKCPVIPHKLPVAIIQARMKIILDTGFSAFFIYFCLI